MDLKQARNKLTDISQSTAIKHPKILVGELCVVVKFLLNEIDRIKTPSMSVLEQNLDPDLHKSIHTPPLIPCRPPWPDKPKPHCPGYEPPKQREGNAGDAE
jgi:hypothetical protein